MKFPSKKECQQIIEKCKKAIFKALRKENDMSYYDVLRSQNRVQSKRFRVKYGILKKNNQKRYKDEN